MRINENTVLTGERCVLVPYKKEHVLRYHEWMQSEELQKLTASEPLTLEEEYEMQRTWHVDEDKLTFIVLDKGMEGTLTPGECGGRMAGDVNLFFSVRQPSYHSVEETEVEPDVREAEVEVMIAEPESRRKGIASESVKMLLHYAVCHTDVAVFVAKIGSDNEASRAFFTSVLGFEEIRYVAAFEEYTYERVVDDELKEWLANECGHVVESTYSDSTEPGVDGVDVAEQPTAAAAISVADTTATPTSTPTSTTTTTTTPTTTTTTGADDQANSVTHAPKQQYVTEFLRACQLGVVEGVRSFVVDQGVSVAVADDDGKSGLRHAAERGNDDVIAELIALGADLNATDTYERQGWTALCAAAYHGHANAVRLLTAAGAEVEAVSRLGETALLLACSRGRAAAVSALVDAGADVNVCTSGVTPLLAAALFGNPASVRCLLGAGADTEARQLATNSTALIEATKWGFESIVRILLGAGADANARDGGGFTALMHSMLPELSTLLIAAGADVNVRSNSGTCALAVAVTLEEPRMVTALIAAGAEVDSVDAKGATPLVFATVMYCADEARVLLCAGADPHLRPHDSMAALGVPQIAQTAYETACERANTALPALCAEYSLCAEEEWAVLVV